MASSFVVLFLTALFIAFSLQICQSSKVRRSDDPSSASLEALIQQQASLIQSLQARVSALETGQQANTGRIQTLENSQPVQVTTCPDGWTQYQSSCYAVGEESLPWSEAAEVCERFGGGLAEVETSTENDFLKQQARLHGLGGYWLGGTDILTEGQWVWVGSKKPIGRDGGFADWDSGQPDDSPDQDCVRLLKNFAYRWDDVVCSDPNSFICEIKL